MFIDLFKVFPGFLSLILWHFLVVNCDHFLGLCKFKFYVASWAWKQDIQVLIPLWHMYSFNQFYLIRHHMHLPWLCFYPLCVRTADDDEKCTVSKIHSVHGRRSSL